jgi:hypothetical protein
MPSFAYPLSMAQRRVTWVAIRLAAICLLAGVVASVATGLGFSAWYDFRRQKETMTLPGTWPLVPPLKWPTVPDVRIDFHAFGVRGSEGIFRGLPGEAKYMEVTTYGWPLACMRERSMGGFPSGPEIPMSWLLRGRHLPDGHHRLAFEPVPIPLLIDSVLFGLPVFLIRFGLRWVRHRVRAAVRCCSTCGYNLAGLPSGACPECGKGAQ